MKEEGNFLFFRGIFELKEKYQPNNKMFFQNRQNSTKLYNKVLIFLRTFENLFEFFVII